MGCNSSVPVPASSRQVVAVSRSLKGIRISSRRGVVAFSSTASSVQLSVPSPNNHNNKNASGSVSPTSTVPTTGTSASAEERSPAPVQVEADEDPSRVSDFSLLEEEFVDFEHWMDAVNHGKKPTLRQQLELAIQLYCQAFEITSLDLDLAELIRLLETFSVSSAGQLGSLQRGLQVGWFVDVFCESPYLLRLREFGCETWFVAKVCLVVVFLATTTSSRQVTGGAALVDHVSALVVAWNLKGFAAVQAPATVYVSYTGRYTLEHLVEALQQLDPRAYLWMDWIGLNPLAWAGRSDSGDDSFRQAFLQDWERHMQTIGHSCLVLNEWRDVAKDALSRMWILWEVLVTTTTTTSANNNNNNKLQVVLTPEQEQDFVEQCFETEDAMDTLLDLLDGDDGNGTKVQKKKAQAEADRLIAPRVQSKGGKDVVKAQVVAALLREWVVPLGRLQLERRRTQPVGPSVALLGNLAIVLYRQGQLEEAEALFREALALRIQSGNGHSPETLQAQGNLAQLLRLQGKLDEAEALARETLEGYRQTLGNAHPDTLRAVNNMAVVLWERGGTWEEAAPLYAEALEGRRHVLGSDHPETLVSIHNMAFGVQAQGQLEEASQLFSEILMQKRKLGEEHPETLVAMNNLAGVLRDQGKLVQAERLLRKVLEARLQQATLGTNNGGKATSSKRLALLRRSSKRNMNKSDKGKTLYRLSLEALQQQSLVVPEELSSSLQPSTLRIVHNAASLLQRQGRVEESEALFRKVVEKATAELGEDHAETLRAQDQLAAVLLERGGEHAAEAEALFRHVLTTRQKQGDDEKQHHPDALLSVNNLAVLLRSQGQMDEAERLCREALEGLRRTAGNKHPSTLNALHNLAILLQAGQQLEEAEALFREVLQGRQASLGANHRDTLLSMMNLACCLLRAGKLVEAEALLRATLQLQREKLGAEHLDTLACMSHLAALLQDSGQKTTDEAERLFRESLQGRERKLGDEHPVTLLSINSLAVLLRDSGRSAEAEPLFRKALAGQEGKLGMQHQDTLITLDNFSVLLFMQGDLDEAEGLLRKAVASRRQTLSDAHADTLFSINYLAMVLQKQGKLEEAEDLFREVLEAKRQKLGNDEHSLDTINAMDKLAFVLLDQDKLEEAEALFRQVLKGNRQIRGDNDPATLAAVDTLAIVLQEQGKFAEAEQQFLQLLQARKQAPGKNGHADTISAMDRLLVVLLRQGKLDEAEKLLCYVVKARQQTLGDNHPDTVASRNDLAALRQKLENRPPANESQG